MGNPALPNGSFSHAESIVGSTKYAVIHAAEVGIAGGLVTKYFMKEGAFLKPAMWITVSAFIGGQLVYRASPKGSTAEEYRSKLSDNLSVALASGAVYGLMCRFVAAKCSNMGALKMAGVGAAVTLAGELAAPVVTMPIANALGM